MQRMLYADDKSMKNDRKKSSFPSIYTSAGQLGGERHRWNRYRRPAVPVRSGPGPHFRPAGLPFDRSGPVDRPVTGRPATDRFIFLIFSAFFIGNYSKFLLDFNKISQRIHKEPSEKVCHINYHY
jgi:hypothetical protein